MKRRAGPEVLGSRTLARSWRVEYLEDTIRYGRARPTKYTWYRSPDIVVVAAQRRDGFIPLVRQYRYGARRAFWELPGGLIEDA